MTGIILIIALAVLIEAAVEYVKTIVDMIVHRQYKTAALQMASMIVAVLLCFAASADLFAVVGIVFSRPWIGVLLTGIFASRGSNYMSDFVGRIRAKSADAQF